MPWLLLRNWETGRHLIQRSVHEKTPYELWHEKKADLSNLQTFGFIAYSHVPDENRKKLDPKAVKLKFMGYNMTTKGYRLMDDDTTEDISAFRSFKSVGSVNARRL